MKNVVFWALAAIVAVILALLGYGVYLSVTHASSGFDVVTATCTGFILVGSLVAWELLMKPGYYRRRSDEPARAPGPADRDDGGPPRPPSR